MKSFFSKFFGGNKSDKDVKKLAPTVAAINKYFEEYNALTNDQLRNKTQEFKSRIKDYLADISAEIENLNEKAEALDSTDFHSKEKIYSEVDKLKKAKDEKLEEILLDILPEAYAVMKQAGKRFAENTTVVSTATDLDKKLMESGKSYISIENGQAYYQNSWTAAGVPVTWNMIHYDVQLIGGIILHQGKIAEMATGEGKTLVSTLPSYLNALAGEGIHIVTVNEYLARRDQEWNTPVFEFLGLTTDCIDKHQPNSPARRNAYLADITYGTNNEFGFDYLRDNMVSKTADMVQRKHHFAMVDEVDSVLIDDARTPLIISGPIARGGEQQEFQALKPRIEKLIEAQRKIVNQTFIEAKRLIAEGKTDKETGGLYLYRAFKGLPKNGALIKFLSEDGNRQILQKAENHFIGEQQRHMPKVKEELYFTIDEKNNSVDLTDKGLKLITGVSEDPNFFVLPDISTGLAQIEKTAANEQEKAERKESLIQEYAQKSERIHSIQQLLKAYTLFEKDVEYVVMEGKVKIVDEQTGRIMEGRRYSDGLHQAIEAKENVQVEAATQTFATVTLQNYFRMFHKLCGMTGTAETEAGELWEIYKLDVVVIPTNRGIARKDQQDLVYKTKREKFKAVIDEVEALRAMGRPVLVGTTSVEVSELLSRMLQQKKIEHFVLNAKQHQKEADIVAAAGQAGAVTIATNMAGRGTDIKLGAGVKEAGGLAIIGTERHESRRVDRQLRGRAGRQGDPGSSQFFVSLEDNLMRLFGSERISGIMDRLGHKEGEVLQHGMISKSIERAQKKVEENNFGVRKRLLEYDDVMNSQREVIYKRRRNALTGERLSIDIDNALFDVASDIAGNAQDLESLKIECITKLSIDPEVTEADMSNRDKLAELVYNQAKDTYQKKKETIKAMVLPQFKMIKEQQHQIQNILIPFTDGNKGLQVSVPLDQAIEDGGDSVYKALENSVTLAMIDDQWKEHLRSMDDLRQSVQMASYEQKDPLLIYKFEAFELFKQMLIEINSNIISFLTRAGIPMPEQQAPMPVPQVMDTGYDDYVDNKEQVDRVGDNYSVDSNDYYSEDHVINAQKPMGAEGTMNSELPSSDDPKVNRNEMCPCGSGKKYKQCHGKAI